MKALCVFGTRPEIIKLSPIIWASENLEGFKLVLAHTGQHYDPLMSDVFIKELEIPPPSYHFKASPGSPTEQITKIMFEVEKAVEAESPDIILVQGDTNTVPAVCVAARRKFTPVGHVEAGLRSFNERSVEEANRRIAAALALYHFAPTWLNFFFLTFEGVPPHRIYVTGNTIVDVINRFKPRIQTSRILGKLGFKPREKFILLTVHRPENVDNPEILKRVIEALTLLKKYRTIFPIHPRTRRKLEEYGLSSQLKNLSRLEVIDPLPYLDFLALLSHSSLVITDSGGVQEEASIFKKPILTLRNTTPRWETVFSRINILVGVKPRLIAETAKFILETSEISKRLAKTPSLYGDGKAGKRIVKIIKRLWSEGKLKYPETEPPKPFTSKFLGLYFHGYNTA